MSRKIIHSGFIASFKVISYLAFSLFGIAKFAMADGEHRVCLTSGAANKVLEKIRAEAPGVMTKIFVKPGDFVKKGQILGHTDLDQAKFQLELARLAMDARGNVDAAEGQAEAWTAKRSETEEAVKSRKADETQLDWAIAMEKMHHANYQTQLDTEEVQKVQYDHWKTQYEKRFIKAPLDGVITEVVVNLGGQINYATHAFTIANDQVYSLPVAIPAELADAALSERTLPVRIAGVPNSVVNATVNDIVDSPSAGQKIMRLLVKPSDLPINSRQKIKGTTFDVLMPEAPMKEQASVEN